MTNRLRMLVALSILGLVLGVLRSQGILSTLSLSVLIWLFGSWILFVLREQTTWKYLELKRTINQQCIGSPILWASRPVQVEVALSLRQGMVPPFLFCSDLLSDNFQWQSGHPSILNMSNSPEVKLAYQGTCLSSGSVTFAGVHCRLSDPQGLFFSERVIGESIQYRVLPGFALVRDRRSTVKRVNSIPHHGVHQLQRAGVGSELLELREYQDGDPPKSIAWKVSARRDKLMIRQYESEVPVKISILLSGSGQMRLGGFGRRLLDQAMHMAASIAKSALAVGDPVGMILVDSQVRQRVSHGNGDRMFYRILQTLSDFSMLPPPIPPKLSLEQLSMLRDICWERFPERMVDRVNPSRWSLFPIRYSKRRRVDERRKISRLLSAMETSSPLDTSRLYFDDEVFAIHAWRLLAQMERPWQPPYVSISEFHNLGVFDATILARELTLGVTRAHDNELFVIITDLVNHPEAVNRLTPALRLALARHHRVVVVCPSPTWKKMDATSTWPAPTSVEEISDHAEQILYAETATKIKKQLAGMGARMVFTGENHVVPVVMNEAELAGTGRTILRRESR